MNINFSIAMAYNNRKKQIINTLNQFEKLYFNKYNFEVVIVDDNSSIDEQLFDILHNYSYSIVYKYLDINEKGDNINPCIVYNKAFSLCNNEIIIIQNPECIHVTNILECLTQLDFKDTYYTIPVLTSLTFEINDNIYKMIENNSKEEIISYLENININSGSITYKDSKGWYNHSLYRNEHLHFCSAISRINLDKLEGFDENYSKDLWYDDNEFIFRISKFLKLNMLNDQLAIHLYHSSGTTTHSNEWHQKSIIRNKNRFENLKNKRHDNIISWNNENKKIIYQNKNILL